MENITIKNYIVNLTSIDYFNRLKKIKNLNYRIDLYKNILLFVIFFIISASITTLAIYQNRYNISFKILILLITIFLVISIYYLINILFITKLKKTYNSEKINLEREKNEIDSLYINESDELNYIISLY